MVTVTGNTTNSDSAGKDKITEYNKVQAELNEKDRVIQEAQSKQSRELFAKLNQIEEKSHCGSVRFLDRLADFFEFGGEKVADKLRGYTTKINAPCAIPFAKKKK